MYSIRFKGKRSFRNPEMIIYKTNYTRVSKVLLIAGFYEDWNHKKQLFQEKSPENKLKNKRLMQIRMKYLTVIDKWESQQVNWTPIELSHSLNRSKESAAPELHWSVR